jgi:Cyclin, N-terminal domain/Cyclin, C-terminal domain
MALVSSTDCSAFSYELTEDVLKAMGKIEAGRYKCNDYLALRPNLARDGVDESWRQRMAEWMYGVVDHCNFRRDIVSVAMAYLDLLLSKGSDFISSKRTFQLGAITCLYLAMKVFDTTFVKLSSLVRLGRGLFTESDVLEMEMLILTKLEWRVHPPTPMCFLRHYTRLIPSTISSSTSFMITEVSRFVAEISVCLYKFIKYPPSMIAYAALCIAMDGIDDSSLPLWQREQVYYSIDATASVRHSQLEVKKLISKLRAAFEKNVDVNQLMTTIDPSCRVRRSVLSKTMSEGGDSPKEVSSMYD